MSAPDDALVAAWRRVAGANHRDAEELLVRRHAEPGRHYHTAEHVIWVLRHVDALIDADPSDLDADAVRVAALFHDIVYDPRSAANEADSAELAVVAVTALGWAEERRDLVRTLIEATATHRATIPEAAVLLDADLGVLGGDPDDYRAYVRHVRLEYGFVDDDAWRRGRATVLRSFLDRPRIFATAAMFETRESRARANLAAELADLEPVADH